MKIEELKRELQGLFADRKKIPLKLNIASYKSKDQVVLALNVPKEKIVHEINRRLAHLDMVIENKHLKAYYHTHEVQNPLRLNSEDYQDFTHKGAIFYRVANPDYDESEISG